MNNRISKELDQYARMIFNAISKSWKNNTAHLSSSTEIANHEDMRILLEIFGKAESLLPYILEDMQKGSVEWVHVLPVITGENPVSEENAGNIQKMADTWLEWGKDYLNTD